MKLDELHWKDLTGYRIKESRIRTRRGEIIIQATIDGGSLTAGEHIILKEGHYWIGFYDHSVPNKAWPNVDPLTAQCVLLSLLDT